MLFQVLAAVFLVTVQGLAEDPTKICLPDVFQSKIYSLGRNMGGTVAYDLPKEMVALHYMDGLRLVFNLADLSSAIINETDGSCMKTTNNDYVKDMNLKCLPADAKAMGEDVTTMLGLSPGGLEIQGWEFTLPNTGIVRVALTKSTPPVPVIMQHIAKDPMHHSDVEIFLNPKTSIDDNSIFTIPAVCPPHTTVG